MLFVKNKVKYCELDVEVNVGVSTPALTSWSPMSVRAARARERGLVVAR